MKSDLRGGPAIDPRLLSICIIDYLLVTYMEQLAPPPATAMSPPIVLADIAQECPEADDLHLYHLVGKPLQWDERHPDARACALSFLRISSTAVYILRHGGQPVGFCEFDGVGERDVELKHFCLIPGVYGRRLGSYLLDWSLRSISNHRPGPVWLRTDINDRLKVKASYERIGFSDYAEV